MRIKTLKKVVILAMTAVFVMASSIIVSAEEDSYFAKPRQKSSCDNVNCKGHVSIHDEDRGVDIFYCVPETWTGSVDEYRTKAAEYLAAQPKEVIVEESTEYPYFAFPRLNSNCDNVNCKGHVSVNDPDTGLDLYYCIPDSWTGSFSEFQDKLEEVLAE